MIPHSRPWILPEDAEAVQVALREGAVCTWHHAAALAEALVRRSGAARCRLYATGTLALRAALVSLALPPGSRVGIPSFTCPDVLKAVVAAGHAPHIIDCDEQGLLLADDAAGLVRLGRMQALVVVHQFGLLHRGAASLTSRLPVIEDCSHVPPGFYVDGSAMAIGSMEGTKLLGAGEGGYLLHRQGPAREADPREGFEEVGNRLSDVLAVLALNQLRRLEENLRRRADLAARYKKTCSFGSIVEGERGAWFRFVIQTDSRAEADALIRLGEPNGITLRRPIMPTPLHRQWRTGEHACPTADRLWDTWVSVPFYPALTEDERKHVVHFLKSVGERP